VLTIQSNAATNAATTSVSISRNLLKVGALQQQVDEQLTKVAPGELTIEIKDPNDLIWIFINEDLESNNGVIPPWVFLTVDGILKFCGLLDPSRMVQHISGSKRSVEFTAVDWSSTLAQQYLGSPTATPRQAGAVYQVGQMALSGSVTYLCVHGGTTGFGNGPQGVSPSYFFPWVVAYNAVNSYAVDQMVAYGGSIWMLLLPVSANTAAPSAGSTWINMGAGTAAYATGTACYYNGSIWTAAANIPATNTTPPAAGAWVNQGAGSPCYIDGTCGWAYIPPSWQRPVPIGANNGTSLGQMGYNTPSGFWQGNNWDQNSIIMGLPCTWVNTGTTLQYATRPVFVSALPLSAYSVPSPCFPPGTIASVQNVVGGAQSQVSADGTAWVPVYDSTPPAGYWKVLALGSSLDPGNIANMWPVGGNNTANNGVELLNGAECLYMDHCPWPTRTDNPDFLAGYPFGADVTWTTGHNASGGGQWQCTFEVAGATAQDLDYWTTTQAITSETNILPLNNVNGIVVGDKQHVLSGTSSTSYTVAGVDPILSQITTTEKINNIPLASQVYWDDDDALMYVNEDPRKMIPLICSPYQCDLSRFEQPSTYPLPMFGWLPLRGIQACSGGTCTLSGTTLTIVEAPTNGMLSIGASILAAGVPFGAIARQLLSGELNAPDSTYEMSAALTTTTTPVSFSARNDDLFAIGDLEPTLQGTLKLQTGANWWSYATGTWSPVPSYSWTGTPDAGWTMTSPAVPYTPQADWSQQVTTPPGTLMPYEMFCYAASYRLRNRAYSDASYYRENNGLIEVNANGAVKLVNGTYVSQTTDQYGNTTYYYEENGQQYPTTGTLINFTMWTPLGANVSGSTGNAGQTTETSAFPVYDYTQPTPQRWLFYNTNGAYLWNWSAFTITPWQVVCSGGTASFATTAAGPTMTLKSVPTQGSVIIPANWSYPIPPHSGLHPTGMEVHANGVPPGTSVLELLSGVLNAPGSVYLLSNPVTTESIESFTGFHWGPEGAEHVWPTLPGNGSTTHSYVQSAVPFLQEGTNTGYILGYTVYEYQGGTSGNSWNSATTAGDTLYLVNPAGGLVSSVVVPSALVNGLLVTTPWATYLVAGAAIGIVQINSTGASIGAIAPGQLLPISPMWMVDTCTAFFANTLCAINANQFVIFGRFDSTKNGTPTTETWMYVIQTSLTADTMLDQSVLWSEKIAEGVPPTIGCVRDTSTPTYAQYGTARIVGHYGGSLFQVDTLRPFCIERWQPSGMTSQEALEHIGQVFAAIPIPDCTGTMHLVSRAPANPPAPYNINVKQTKVDTTWNWKDYFSIVTVGSQDSNFEYDAFAQGTDGTFLEGGGRLEINNQPMIWSDSGCAGMAIATVKWVGVPRAQSDQSWFYRDPNSAAPWETVLLFDRITINGGSQPYRVMSLNPDLIKGRCNSGLLTD
jgi:hypothetical protein